MSIGKTLAEARRKAGLTVEQVSDATRVRQTIIREIEQDNFEHCGGDFYARGHIRSIAQAIGVDPKPLLEEFDRLHNPTVTAPKAAEVFEPDAVRPERRGPNWSAAMATALVILVIYGIVQAFTSGTEPREPSTIAAKTPTPSLSSAGATPSGVPRPTPSAGAEAVAQIPRDRVTVRVEIVNGQSWLQVFDSRGEQVFEGTLGQGTARDFTDKKRIRLVVGNAAAVRLIVNGKDLGTPGKEGEVMSFVFRPGEPGQAG
ncbi:helix-turn-helix domain-containing protein [Carbonactinospora thermoautotrophica]|uniref:HTH cro/C1-type domain-containing protein n=1 Tax=Carbonactinospora thermoautotrophica TaxID=1469144 RepID=A0A132N2X7_9ACTN|nr:helix-turn-helix domain-containing protein [Carbonactinospora thermoautotrophica]KWW99739.1 hypothetical protein LI90_1378 [Carbonactinospora thermoautotrophica]KWX04501.1 hypothetical protein TH66_08035 [Carbonactinospora thermoautotrophica]KWX08362.1 hypothetical protein TR74_15325 [Carbonactinospora thermoautotrophica]MCX9191261.1 helix-turn-helix domain-containing protein [Carbonactinospora thermoautotrophica]